MGIFFKKGRRYFMSDFVKYEDQIREFLFECLKTRTKIFLDFVDTIIKNPQTPVGMVAVLEELKKRGKQQFLECQGEMLSGLKCIFETGAFPKGIDKRGDNKSDQK